ncbi:MAG: methyltransferase domain-containing protein [Deltaproteobacteria bacterium]|nr:MAG: methyltransferase domain-containing protein [Deltaproteobacteria bacterium]TMQ20598.1 MAG: methyltransferase domain-containing protein [Deltaproteobacteria bacterium]
MPGRSAAESPLSSPLAEQRWSLAERGAAVLYQLGAARVWVFGSLACGRAQDRRSDIDLAVEGLPQHVVDGATAAVERATGCHVDIIALDSHLPVQLRAQAMRNRVLVRRVDVATDPPVSRWYGAPAPGRRLFQQRIDAAIATLAGTAASRVIDLGCGQAWLLEVLARDPRYHALGGIDMSSGALAAARERLQRALPPAALARVQLFVGIVTWRDPRLAGWDAATAIEVIEHLDDERRAAFEDVVFAFMRPATILVTTPNADYNLNYLLGRGLRHPEHKFEWTRAQFAAWAAEIAQRSGYRVKHSHIGPFDEMAGGPTQMAVFQR